MKITALLGSVVCLILLATSALAAPILTREFTFAPDLLHLDAHDGFTDIRVDGAAPSVDFGMPELPWLSRFVDLPAGMQVASLEIVDTAFEPVAQGVRLESAWTVLPGASNPTRSAPDPWAFARPGLQPAQPAELTVQGWQRGQGVAGLRVCPVRWEASTGRLERLTRLKVNLTLEPASQQPVPRLRVVPEWETDGPRGPLRAPISSLSQGFGGRRTEGTLAATQIPSVLGSPVGYLIVTSDEMAGEFQRLADWKTQSGVPAAVRTMSFIRSQYPRGADDGERVRDFIRDAYSLWGTKWVLLGGDTDVIPTRMARNTYSASELVATDLYYSCLDGNWDGDGDYLFGEGYVNDSSPGDSVDLFPDVYIGRAPASTAAEAHKFVDRTLAYERTPVGDYERGILIFAEVLFPESWNPGDGVLLDGGALGDELLPYIGQNPSMRTVRLYENYTFPWVPGALPETRAAVIDSLNRGYGMSVHIGHGYRNVMHVADGNLFNSDALALTNGSRLTNLYAINCNSVAIDFPCMGEALMHANNGGAVTVVGSTRLDFPYAARQFEREYFRLVFDDSVNAVGEAQAKQKVPLIIGSANDNAYRWMQQSLLLLGDPELRMWTGTPRTMTVTAPSVFALSDTSISVTVSILGQPLAGARVTAYKARDGYRSVTTDAAGVAVVPFRIDSLGTITLTVTGYDCRPFQSTINVSAASAPVLGDGTPTIDDDSSGGTSGDGDGIWEAGETIDLRVPVTNAGGTGATGVSATLSTLDSYVSIATSAVTYGAVGAGQTTTPAGAFRLTLSASCPDQREIAFKLAISDGGPQLRIRDLFLTVRAPDLRQFGHDVTDNGNHDGLPNVGEIVTYSTHLKNMGTADAHSVTAVLRALDANATVQDSTSSWGDVTAGQDKVGDALVYTLAATTAKLELRVSDSHGLRFVQRLDVVSPNPPGFVTGNGEPTSIGLQWSPNTESDLMGYNIYRSSSAVGPFTRSNTVVTGRISAYEDGPLTALTRYYYQVSAVDSSGNESLRSAVVSASTNPPTHGSFPIPMNASSFAPAAVDHLYPGYPLDIVAASDVIYAWHPDGVGAGDADGGGETNGDITVRGSNYEGGASIIDLDGNGSKEVVGVASDSTQVVAVLTSGATMSGWPQTIQDGAWSAVAAGDLDNDGKPEIVFSGFTGPRIYAFRWNGTEWRDGDANPATNGVFKVVGTQYNIATPAIADLDNNGIRDIIVCSFDGKLNAWRPDGTNLPGFPITLPEHIGASPAVGYLDGPGDTQLDIVVSTGFYPNPTPTMDSLYVFTATGARKPGFPKPLRVSDNTKPPSPALADMNNDGFVDIVAAGTDGKIYVWDHNGAVVAPMNGRPYSTLNFAASEASPVVADINGDSYNDVVMGDEMGQLTALSGTDGLPLPGFPIQLGSAIKAAAALCDCDGDGMTEIVVAGEDRNVSMWDYNFPFSPVGPPPWPQFHHDARRTGLYTNPAFVSVEPPTDAGAPGANVELAAPAPNPSHRSTQIGYSIPKTETGERLELAIYDLAGRRVRMLESGPARAGRFHAEWNLSDGSGRRVEAGLYFARLSLGRERKTQKIIVVP
jgi:hypothetical protein